MLLVVFVVVVFGKRVCGVHFVALGGPPPTGLDTDDDVVIED